MPDTPVSPAEDLFARFLEDGARDFEELCAARPELERELRRLHAAWCELDGALDALGGSGIEQAPLTNVDFERLAARSERYEVRDRMAAGGMGEVLRVWDPDLRRALAMKCMLVDGTAGPRTDSRSLARFLAEARVTGQLEHPGIPAVHELGVDPSGRLYFTMPLVDGVDLRTLLADMRSGSAPGWTSTRVLGVLQRVCDAVAFAHSRGVVHRDLKPANVMVGRFGEVYVMDWGLAKLPGGERAKDGATDAAASVLDDPSLDSPALTRPGAVLGTPSYMAPEQARGEHERVGPAADVYSMGAVLYEVLTGQTPFVPPGSSPSSDDVLERVLAGPPPPIGQLARDVPAELAAICSRAMAREPGDRYADMSALSSDLRAYVEGRVVQAHRTGTWAELSTWIGRNRALASASALSALLLVAGLTVSTALLIRARAAEGRANENAERLTDELRASHIEQGRQLAATGNMAGADSLLWLEFLRAPDSKHAFWALWERYSREPVLATLVGHAAPARHLCFDPGGEWLASSGAAGTVRLWTPTDWSTVAVLPVASSPLRGLEVVDGGATLIAAAEDGDLTLWDLDRRELRTRWPRLADGIASIAAAPDGQVLATGGPSGVLRLWRVSDGELLVEHALHEAEVHDLAWSNDGARLASASFDGTVGLWDEGGLRFVERFGEHQGLVTAVAFDPSGRVLASGANDQVTILRDLARGTQRRIDADNGTVRALRFLSDGRRLAVAGWHRVDVWRLAPESVERSYSLPVHSEEIEISDDGRWLGVSSSNGTLRVIELVPSDGVRDRSRPGRRVLAAAASGGSRTAFHDPERGVRVFERLLDEEPSLVVPGDVDAMAFDRSGARLGLGRFDRRLVVVDASTGEERARFDGYGPNGANSVDLSPDGALTVYTTDDGGVAVRSLVDGSERCRLAPFEEQPLSVRFDPGGERFALKVRQRPLSVWSVDGELLFEVEQDATSWSADWNADGSLLVGSVWLRDLRVWDGRTGELLRVLPGHAGTPWAVATSPHDPSLAASAAGDGRVMLWDVRTGRNLLRLELSSTDVTTVGFADHGRGLVAGSYQGDARAWDLGRHTRHIAGNLEAQVRRSEALADVEALLDWTRAVLRGATDAPPGGW